jgi:hypothetical protein
MQQLRLLASDDDAVELIESELDRRGHVQRFTAKELSSSGKIQYDVIWRPNTAADANFSWRLVGVTVRERRSGAQ